MDKEKAKYCYLTFSVVFHFSAIIFHVDSCESYATLDTQRGEKSGGVYHCSTVILNPKIQSVKWIAPLNRLDLHSLHDYT